MIIAAPGRKMMIMREVIGQKLLILGVVIGRKTLMIGVVIGQKIYNNRNEYKNI